MILLKSSSEQSGRLIAVGDIHGHKLAQELLLNELSP